MPVAVNDSANGRLVVRLAGLLAGSRGITATVLPLGRGNPEASIRTAIASMSSAASEHAEGRRKVHLTLRTDALPAESAVGKEAEKGYGVLMLGHIMISPGLLFLES
jgi:hypothetical protein